MVSSQIALQCMKPTVKRVRNIVSRFLVSPLAPYHIDKRVVGKHSATEIQEFLKILRSILKELSELIRKKWQIRTICNLLSSLPPFLVSSFLRFLKKAFIHAASILEKILFKENKIQIRKEGLELLMLFFDDIQALEPAQAELFSQSIDLQPFVNDCPGSVPQAISGRYSFRPRLFFSFYRVMYRLSSLIVGSLSCFLC